MIDEVCADCKKEMVGNVDAFKRALAKIRTGRANLAMLDGIRVDYYGTLTPLNQVAALAVPDPRLITIKPWEKNMVAEIDKMIRASDLGLQPQSDGEIVRVPIPPLTEERRRDLVKTAKGKAEEAKVAIRASRRDANEMVKQLQKDGDVPEDDAKKGLKRIQDETDASIKQVDEILAVKEKEILEF
ncbi:MAG: ribosome recycling factor [Deltaproteobacteria bacterium]|nr:ribosome recycling factor [Deltaproteobacteria bacterium]